MEGVDYEVNVQWYKYPPFVRVVWRKFHDTKKKCFIIESNSESFFPGNNNPLSIESIPKRVCDMPFINYHQRLTMNHYIYIYISMRLNGYKGKGIVKWLFL